MAKPAGSTYTILNQRIYIAPLGTPLPALTVPYGGQWPSGWVRVPNTTEGAVISPNVPMDDINSDENDNIGVVPAGGAQINISFTSITPTMDLLDYLMQFEKENYAADSTAGTPAYERHYMNPEGRAFMIGIEGKFPEGGLTDEGGFVRAFGYKVQQTEAVEIQFRSKGSDAALQPAANVRCLSTVLDASQLTGTGIDEVDDKFDIFLIRNA